MARFACAILVWWAVVQTPDAPLAFMDVSVVPMDRPQVLEHQTVVVRQGRIAVLGSATSVRVPEAAMRIDGRGKFLMPGLADMHVHFTREEQPPELEVPVPTGGRRQPGIPASASKDHDLENRAYALMFLANGATTVRNMWGSKTIVDLSNAIGSGRLLGPHIYSVGAITDGNPPIWRSSRIVETAADAENAVHADKQNGFSAIKVYSALSKSAYDAIIVSAQREHFPVVGHVPTSVGLYGAIAARQASIEHLDSFLRALAPNATSAAEAVQQADLTRLAAIVNAAKNADVWFCPTIVVNDQPRTDPAWQDHASFVPLNVFVRYRRMYPNAAINPQSTPQARAVFFAVLQGLHRAGVHLLLGTDTVKLGTLPGYSLHDELENLVAAGLSPYEAIRTGTINAATFLHEENDFGAVRQGLRADLLLVDGNPLTSVTNTSKISGVMAAGHWMTAAELDRQLRELRATYTH